MNGILCLADHFLARIGDVFRFLPKLRAMLFEFLYENTDQIEFSSAKLLLAHSSMATIQCVVKFINGHPKTRAHSENSVCEDLVNFDKIVKKKKEEEGNLRPYYRILNPGDDALNTANFPNLAVAAVEYMKTFGPITYKNMMIKYWIIK